METNVLQTFLQLASKTKNVLVELVFQGPAVCVNAVQQQAASADSPLVRDTPMYSFLVEKEDPTEEASEPPKKVWVPVARGSRATGIPTDRVASNPLSNPQTHRAPSSTSSFL